MSKHTIITRTPSSWEWNKSAATVKKLHKQGEIRSQPVIEELIQAYLHLNPHPGRPWDGRHTWKAYCLAIFPDGYPCEKTIYGWIKPYLGKSSKISKKYFKKGPKEIRKPFFRGKVIEDKYGNRVLHISVPDYPTKVFEYPIPSDL